MAETEYTNDVLHNSKLNVSVDFLNINIRIKLYDLKREYQIKITYFLQKKKKRKNLIYIEISYSIIILHSIFIKFCTEKE